MTEHSGARVQFSAEVESTGGTTAGIRVPDAVVKELGGGKRAKVVVDLGNGHQIRTTLGSHDGSTFLPVSAAVRDRTGIAAGDVLELAISVDTAPRPVEVPDDLAAALASDPAATAFFESLTDSQRKGFVLSVTEAKKPETRAKRVGSAVVALAAGRKRP